jgi:hypothetical protein
MCSHDKIQLVSAILYPYKASISPTYADLLNEWLSFTNNL